MALNALVDLFLPQSAKKCRTQSWVIRLKANSIRFTIVASLGDRVVNFLEIQYRLEFYSNLQIFMGTVLKQVFFLNSA